MTPVSDELRDEIIASAQRTARQTVEDRLAEEEAIVTRGPTGVIHMPGGQEYNRREFDFYPTPRQCCSAALSLLPNSFNPVSIMDPGAGDGPWGWAARRKYETHAAWLYGVDLRDIPKADEYDFWKSGQDYLKMGDTDWSTTSYDLVMGNPPYSQKKEMGPTNLAECFVRTGLASLNRGGYMVFLLRLAFLESQERGTGLWKQHPPKEVHICVERPSFMPEGHPKEGKTDATAYAIYIWEQGWHGTPTIHWMSWK